MQRAQGTAPEREDRPCRDLPPGPADPAQLSRTPTVAVGPEDRSGRGGWSPSPRGLEGLRPTAGQLLSQLFVCEIELAHKRGAYVGDRARLTILELNQDRA